MSGELKVQAAVMVRLIALFTGFIAWKNPIPISKVFATTALSAIHRLQKCPQYCGLALLAFLFAVPGVAQETNVDDWWFWGEPVRTDNEDGSYSIRYPGIVLFLGDLGANREWAFKDMCASSGRRSHDCNSGRIVRSLTGISEIIEAMYPEYDDFRISDIDNYFVENGFRVTGRNAYDYTSFGIWAEDSFWGFWQGSIDNSNLNPWQPQLTPPTLFIAGGSSNPTEPTTGTWTGLAVGKHKLFPEVRVDRSEVVVNLDTREVDVTITGLVFGSVTAAAINGEAQTFEAGLALSWKGLPLYVDGSFDASQEYGVVDSLDDVFSAIVPTSGENYSDTAETIRGAFYGENANEVTGVFSKNDIEGSFGAYRE